MGIPTRGFAATLITLFRTSCSFPEYERSDNQCFAMQTEIVKFPDLCDGMIVLRTMIIYALKWDYSSEQDPRFCAWGVPFVST